MKYVKVEGSLLKLTDEAYAEMFPEPEKTYVDLRKEAYGTVEEQLESIVEIGLPAHKTKILAIKAKFPKPVVK